MPARCLPFLLSHPIKIKDSVAQLTPSKHLPQTLGWWRTPEGKVRCWWHQRKPTSQTLLPSLPLTTQMARPHSKPGCQSELNPKCSRTPRRFLLELKGDQIMWSQDCIQASEMVEEAIYHDRHGISALGGMRKVTSCSHPSVARVYSAQAMDEVTLELSQ